MENKNAFLIRVEPKAVKEHTTIAIDKLRFDHNNVRFAHLRKEKALNQADMFKILKADLGIDELKEQILHAKKVYEELVVDSDMVVKEGNRRLTCLRLLEEDVKSGKLDASYKGLFDRANCAVLLKDADPIDVEIYLAIVHVKGKKPWPAYDKASHIYYLYNVGHLSYDRIVSELGMAKKTVMRSLPVYEKTKIYGDKYGKRDSIWWRKYTYFDELYKRKDLTEWREEDQNIDLFMKWIVDQKINDVRYVRILRQIIDNDAAYKQLQQNGAKAAMAVLGEVDPSLSSKSFRSIKDTIEEIKSMRKEELNSIAKNPAKIKMLQELDGQVSELLKWVKK